MCDLFGRSSTWLGIVAFVLVLVFGVFAPIRIDEAEAMAIYNKSEAKVHVKFDCDSCFSPGWYVFGKKLAPGEADSYPGESGTLQIGVTWETLSVATCRVDDHGWGEITFDSRGNLELTTYHADGGRHCYSRAG